MLLTSIVTGVNTKLAGEILTYAQMQIHLDSVVDDINAELNAVFPAFSEFNSSEYTGYPNYNFFPDRFIRSVVFVGAAYKFLITDEEGAESAPAFGEEYRTKLFQMKRDYSNSVPSEYQADYQGYVLGDEDTTYDPDDPNASDVFPDIRYVEQTSTASAWNGRHLTLGNYHVWVDSDANMRIKYGDPTSETDGTIIGLTNTASYDSAIADLIADLGAVESDITTIQGDITTVEGDITTIEGDITTIEGDIVDIEAALTLLPTTKVKFTAEGGLAIKLTNKTGSPSVKGTTVAASSGTDNAFILQAAEYETIGVVYEAGIADASECWVVVSGIADVLLKDSTGSTRGHIVFAADTDGRAVTAVVPTPPNSDSHFKEIGHCIESKSSGTSVLCKCVLHFN